MIRFFLTLWGFLVGFWRGLRDREFRALFLVFLGLLLAGTGFYSSVEGWSLLDSLYFSVMTLSTVGYGDLAPTTELSKMFTIVYILAGAGIFVAFITKVTEGRLHHRSPDPGDDGR